MSIQAIVVFDGCVDYFAIRDSNSGDKIRCVFGLSEIVIIREWKDFKTTKNN